MAHQSNVDTADTKPKANQPTYVPPSEISRRMAEIQLGWDDKTRQRRNEPEWRPPDE